MYQTLHKACYAFTGNPDPVAKVILGISWLWIWYRLDMGLISGAILAFLLALPLTFIIGAILIALASVVLAIGGLISLVQELRDDCRPLQD